MSRLPVVSGQEAMKAFERAGWKQKRRKGSHITLTKTGKNAILTVPLHKELDRGTLRALIKAAGLSTEEFIQLL